MTPRTLHAPRLRGLAAILAAAVSAACASRASEPPVSPVPAPAPGAGTGAAPMPPAFEMRGVWIATVGNIDWPSVAARGDADRQKAELRTLLDRAAADGMNAVILQVRSGADALYPSVFEPWAGLLTGTPGTDPGYDPIAFAVDEAHARGLELHAWFNPYRAGSTRDSLALPAKHVFRARRDLVRVYGGALWMDPGDPAVAVRTIAAMTDVARRYDVDGIHIDDFFYPYPITDSAGRAVPFPDSATWAANNPRALSRADWRRDNVNRFVEWMYAEVHRVKPWLKVGVSPFGIWRPGNPPGVRGLDAYDAIYADARLWLQQGWLDYFVPQLYWAIDPPAQSFTALLDWWTAPEQNPSGRPVWPGLAAYRVDTVALRPDSATLPRTADTVAFTYRPSEILRQVRETRARAGRRATGVVFYNGSSVLARAGGALGGMVRDSLFAAPALVPPAPWLGAAVPGRSTVVLADTTVGGAPARVARLTPGSGDDVRWWVVSWRVGGAWTRPERVWGAVRAVVGRGEAVAVWGVSRAGVVGGEMIVSR